MRDRERGAALVWALVLLGFAASLSALLLERGRTLDAGSKADLASLKALYAAEGGIAAARHALARDPAWVGETVRVGECEVMIRVERRDGRWLVRSRAGAAAIEATLSGTAGLPAIEPYSETRR